MRYTQRKNFSLSEKKIQKHECFDKQINRMLLVHVSTCTITFFHQSASIRKDNCWTVNTFQRAWGFFFPLIFFAFPLFLWAAVLVSSLSIRNHLEQILTLWQILSGNWVQNEEKTKHLVCLLLSALTNRSYASQLCLTERKLTKTSSITMPWSSSHLE